MKRIDLETVRDYGYLEGILWGIPVDVDSRTLDDIMTQVCVETDGGMAGLEIIEKWLSQDTKSIDELEMFEKWNTLNSRLREKYGIAKLKQIARKISSARLKASSI